MGSPSKRPIWQRSISGGPNRSCNPKNGQVSPDSIVNILYSEREGERPHPTRNVRRVNHDGRYMHASRIEFCWMEDHEVYLRDLALPGKHRATDSLPHLTYGRERNQSIRPRQLADHVQTLARRGTTHQNPCDRNTVQVVLPLAERSHSHTHKTARAHVLLCSVNLQALIVLSVRWSVGYSMSEDNVRADPKIRSQGLTTVGE